MATTTSQVLNDSSVPGSTVRSALNALNPFASISALRNNALTSIVGTVQVAGAQGGQFYYNAADTTTGWTGTLTISGTTLTIVSTTSGAMAAGLFLNSGTGAWIASGSGATWTLSSAPGNVAVATAATADEGGIKIVDSNGRRWYREFNGAANAEFYGISTSASAATNAAALTYASFNSLNFPGPGAYQLNIASSSANLSFSPGAYLQPLAAQTVTLTGNVQDTKSKIFDSATYGGLIAGTLGGGNVRPEWWGASSPGVEAINIAAVNAAITFVNSRYNTYNYGGAVVLSQLYKAGSGILLRDFVNLVAEGYESGAAIGNISGSTSQSPIAGFDCSASTSSGYVIASANSTIGNAACVGFAIIGQIHGSPYAGLGLGGMRIAGPKWCIFAYLNFFALANEGAIIGTSDTSSSYAEACYIKENTMVFCMQGQNGTFNRTSRSGVLVVAGSDNYIIGGEYGTQYRGVISNSALNVAACYVAPFSGGTPAGYFIQDCVFELSDCGLYLTGQHHRITGVRCDTNNGHGFFINGTYSCEFANCEAFNNAGNNSQKYSDWNTVGCNQNQYTGCKSYAVLNNGNSVTAPSAPALSQTAGGALGATTYYVKITYQTAGALTSPQETVASSESSLAVSANNLLVVASPASMSGATGYNVYVGTASGSETKQNATPISIGTNWTEPAGGLVAGYGYPQFWVTYSYSDDCNDDFYKNYYTGCLAGGLAGPGAQSPALFNFSGDKGAAFNVYDGAAKTLPVNSVTPSVFQYANWRTGNTAATSITNFLNPVDGQRISIFMNDSNTTIVNGTNIATTSGANISPVYGTLVSFRWYNVFGKWVQD